LILSCSLFGRWTSFNQFQRPALVYQPRPYEQARHYGDTFLCQDRKYIVLIMFANTQHVFNSDFLMIYVGAASAVFKMLSSIGRGVQIPMRRGRITDDIWTE
jgi:hypothetical protein